MSVTRSTLVSGPCKIVRSGSTLFTEGDLVIAPRLSLQDVATSMHGVVGASLDDVVYEATFTPCGVYAYNSILFPYIGNGSNDSEQKPGYRIMTDSDVPTVITGRDGGVYTLKASAITQMPDLFLGPTRSLFGPATITAVVANAANPEDADSFMSVGSGSYSDATFNPSAIVRQRYTAAWGAVSGFTSFQAQDFWTVQSQLALEPVQVQGYTRDIRIRSLRYMAKCIPVGPTGAQIEAALRAQGSGAVEGRRQSGGAADLVITGSGVSVTLKNAALREAGYVFGGVPLRNGEIGLETTIAFSSGIPVPQLILA